MFRKLILFLLFVSCFCLPAPAQTENYNAQIKWERYKVSASEVSVLLPKMPILFKTPNRCSELDTSTYAAYAQEVVYTFIITSKISVKDWGNCPYKNKFDEKSFEARVSYLSASRNDAEVTRYSQKDLEAVRITGKNPTSINTYWLFNDFKNKRWFELWTSHREDIKPETKDFSASIKVGKKIVGIEINAGALRTFGDLTENISTNTTPVIPGTGAGSGMGSGKKEDNKFDELAEKIDKSSDITKTLPIVVVHKPSARYTDEARKLNIQGSVTLKVTFLTSGGIGSVTPVSSLPYGLTEQAIEAARKLVFIPAKKNGTKVTIIKTVVYSFTIY
jgi:TonB family protein